MNITTTFSCGDKGWVYQGDVRQLTVGRVTTEVTDSPGDAGFSMYDNYKPQSGFVERCMCVETGIGSGNVYTVGEHIFVTKDECIAANAKRIAEQERAEAKRAADERKRLLDSEASIRRQLAKIEAAKAEAKS